MGAASVDYSEIAKWLGYVLMGLLSWVGVRMWNDVAHLKSTHISKDQFDKAIADMKAETKAERDAKHVENTGNFRRVEDLITKGNDNWNRDYRDISKLLSDMRVTQAQQGASLEIERRRLPPEPTGKGQS